MNLGIGLGVGVVDNIGKGGVVGGNTISVARLLDDQFTDTVAAGSVNGTNATPGLGARVVVDTGNRLSIGSGVMSLNGYEATGDDPRWSYTPSFTRAAGLALSIDIYSQTTLIDCLMCGWMNATGTGATRFEETIYVNSDVRFYDGTTHSGLAGTLATNTYRKYIIVLRSTGGYLIEVSADLQTFTLLYVGGVGSTSTLYVGGTSRTLGGLVNYDNAVVGQLGGGWADDSYSGASVPLTITGTDKSWLTALCCG